MASLVLGVAGAYVGSFFGPFGASVGWMIGSAVGSSLDPQKVEGPRLTDLKLQTSQYGQMIPIVYGTNRLTGNVIWQTDLQEASHTSGGKGGGGPKVTTYTYSASWAVRICEGEAVIKRVWANGRLVWAEDGSATDLEFTQYPGDESQLADPTMEAELGAGNVPAYRGICYAVFANIELAQFGNVLPQLSFEVSSVPSVVGIQEVKYRRDFGFSIAETSSNYGEQPRILKWPMNGTDPIHIAIVPRTGFYNGPYFTGDLYLDRVTLDVTTAALGSVTQDYQYDRSGGNLTDHWPLQDYDTIYTVPEYHYYYVGEYMGNPLSIGASMGVLDEATVRGDKAYRFPLIIRSTPNWYTEPINPYDPADARVMHTVTGANGNDAFRWGLPVASMITAAVVSQDGRSLLLLVCTSPTPATLPAGGSAPGLPGTPSWTGFPYGDASNGGPFPVDAYNWPYWTDTGTDAWYLIVDDAMADSGTVANGFFGFGNTSSSGGKGAVSLENNGRWIWYIATDKKVEIYHIDDSGVLDLDAATTAATNTYWLNAYYGGGQGYSLQEVRSTDPNGVGGYWTFTNGVPHLPRVGIPTAADDAAQSGPWIGPTDSGHYGAGQLSIYCTAADGYCGTISTNVDFPTVWVSLLRRVSPQTEGITLGEIVAAISERPEIALESTQYDVTELTDIVHGYTIGNQSTGRACIEALQPPYFFDAVESDALIRYVKRGADAVVAIAEDDLGAITDSSEPVARISRSRGQELDLPQRVDVVYIDQDADYQNGEQESQRMAGGARNAVTINVPVAMDALKAKQIADAQLFSAWYARDRARLQLPMKYAYLDPCDVVTVRGRNYRVNEMTAGADRVLKLSAVAELSALWFQVGVPAPGSGIVPQTPPTRQLTDMLLLDIPYIIDADHQQVYYAALAGHDRPAWAGAAIYKSIDSGTSYSQIAVDNNAPDVMGTASTVLADWTGGNVFDEAHTVTVVIGAGGGELESVTREAVLNGGNEFLLGDEIIRARTCTLTATSTYVLSGLLRGRRGTEWATGTHAIGERFVALPVSTVLDANFAEYGALRQYKPVTVGSALAEAVAQDFTNSGIILKPYSPVQLYGGRNASGDVTLTWRRRARVNNAWLEGVEIALGELIEQYVVRFYTDSTYATSFANFSSTADYTVTAAEQTTMFGSPQDPLYCSVAQIGQLGDGYEIRGAV